MIYTVTMTSLNGKQDYAVDVITEERRRARAVAGEVIAEHVANNFRGPEGIPWLGDTRTTNVTISLEKVES